MHRSRLCWPYSASANQDTSSAAEQVIQKLLANINTLNGLLAQVVDPASADRLRGQIRLAANEYMGSVKQLTVLARRLSREEDQRLESLHLAQLNRGLAQLESQAARFSALDGQLRFDDINQRIAEMHSRSRDMGRAAQPPAFQPPGAVSVQPPPFQPPTFQPPTFQPPMIPRPSIPKPGRPHGIRPPSMPRHRFGR